MGKGSKRRPISVPLAKFKANWDRIFKQIITTKEKAKMDQLIEQTVTEAFRFAEESPFPMPDDAYQDVFASGIS